MNNENNILKDEPSLNILYEYSWNAFRNKLDHYDRLDYKAISLAGFTGILITLILAFWGKLFLSTDIAECLQCYTFFFIVLIVFLFSDPTPIL